MIWLEILGTGKKIIQMDMKNKGGIKMKKFSFILAALVLSLSLAACNSEVVNNNDVENKEEVKVEDVEFNPIEMEFQHVLDDIKTVEFGTAGSSLKAVSHAVGLMNWAVGSEIYDEQIVKGFNYYFGKLSSEEVGDFRESFDLVYSTYKQLLSENAQALLDDSGVDPMMIGYPTGVEKLDRVELINSLLNK